VAVKVRLYQAVQGDQFLATNKHKTPVEVNMWKKKELARR
jgi:hypothetical protein